MIAEQRRADCSARVARGGLDPDLVEAPVAQELPVRDAVERDTTRETEVALPGLVRERPRHAQQDVVGDGLHRRSEVHVALAET